MSEHTTETRETSIATPLPDAEMRALGFTDHREDHWYYCARVDSDTTLNISIDKGTGAWTEDVLDEYFGQPEYYGNMIEPFRTKIRDNVDREVARLNAAGIAVAVDHREYGFEGEA